MQEKRGHLAVHRARNRAHFQSVRKLINYYSIHEICVTKKSIMFLIQHLLCANISSGTRTYCGDGTSCELESKKKLHKFKFKTM